MAARARLDLLLVQRGLAPTRARAQAMIMAGQVYVMGQKRTKAGEQAPVDAPISCSLTAASPGAGRRRRR